MKLKKLIAGTSIKIYKGSQEIEISGLCAHSKRVAPGNLFIARKGSFDDGANYIEEAIAAGSAAILTNHPNPFLKGITQLIHPHPDAMEALLAAHFYGRPSESLSVIGVTGTNGKTTTSYWIKHFLDKANRPCGLIGTIEYIIKDHRFKAERTTPDAITCQKLLREMAKQGCQACVMEVSSHGLAQGRVDQIGFDVAIFTNLSQDHLDYHGSFETYAQEKAKLFHNLSTNATAIVNSGSPWTPEMVRSCRAKILTYGFESTDDIYASDIQMSAKGSIFTVHFQKKKVKFCMQSIGRYNILNVLSAIGACLVKNIELERLAAYAATLPEVSGRLQRVENHRNLNLFVDYAHTPDALTQVLSCLNELKTGRIITVFGCGGDRDRTKRPLMAKSAEEGSDFAIVTSDNPRSEDPKAICTEIAQGFAKSSHVIIEDRRQAIERAIMIAEKEDLILIAGKGHETYQQFAYQTIPFDDKAIAQEIANRA